MRFFLPVCAVLLAAALAMRLREGLGFPPERHQAAVLLLVNQRTRDEAVDAFRRANPQHVLRCLDARLSQLEGGNLGFQLAVAEVYHDALLRAPARELDALGQRRAAVIALLPAARQRGVSLYLSYLAIAARLGHPLTVAQIQSSIKEITHREVGPYARALAATESPAAVQILVDLNQQATGRRRSSHAIRLAAARGLVRLGDPRGLRILIDAIPLAHSREASLQVEAELAMTLGRCPGVEHADRERWWREHGKHLDPLALRDWRPCFALRTPTVVLVTLSVLIYLGIALVKDQKRWGNFPGVVVLTSGLYLLLSALVSHNLDLALVPFTPYGQLEVSRFVDSVLLPYNTILFMLLALLAPRRPLAPPPTRPSPPRP